MTENNEMIADAIDQSLRQNEIVFLDASDFDDDFDVLRALKDLASDSEDTGEVVEFWGRDSDGDDWRVHVRV